jgi:tRNA(Ile2) C34 agmatinyltransferase TiaS
MLTLEQKVLLEARYPGRVDGIVEGEGIHRCPVCGDVGECLSTGDNFHSCKWCGSTWRSLN